VDRSLVREEPVNLLADRQIAVGEDEHDSSAVVHRRQLVRAIPDAQILREQDPTPTDPEPDPLRIARLLAIIGKMLSDPMDPPARADKRRRGPVTEAAIDEELRFS
jgi:hypothetical protein